VLNSDYYSHISPLKRITSLRLESLKTIFIKQSKQLISLIQHTGKECWVHIAISTWNISRLRNTVKKQLQWLRKRVKKKNLKF